MATASTLEEPVPTADKPPSSWRWLPLSLKMYLGILGLLAVVALCIGARIWQRHTAFAEIDRAQGSVRVTAGGPPWLRRRLGSRSSRVLGRVEFIGLAGKAT